MKQRLLIQIKMVNPLSFLLLSLDMFHKPAEAHCVFMLCCLVFKQADDYNNDDGNDDSDGSSLRRSSCRVERGTDNRPVYSRKGTVWTFKVTAAEW